MSDCIHQLAITLRVTYFLERDATTSTVNAISSYAGRHSFWNEICAKLSLHGLITRLISLWVMQNTVSNVDVKKIRSARKVQN